jgi:hypothetical protein
MQITVNVYEKDAEEMAKRVNKLTARGHKRTSRQVATAFAQDLIDDRFSTEFFDAERFVEYPKER